ncbi:RNA polymerase sigma factor [Paenibacillus sp. UNC451MF]|uniref:RNA polymerase sigma factor n=1 Tax=Paenibacillus sp. UNC451MF TaxID=1449063 RepID=UPI00048CE692|nr:sigma-70 family RNA polymerase sigma factor [Paenibacillus sp. UNC451MF]
MDLRRLHHCILHQQLDDAEVVTFVKDWLPRVVEHQARQEAIGQYRSMGRSDYEEITDKVRDLVFQKIECIEPDKLRAWICQAASFVTKNHLRKRRPILYGTVEDGILNLTVQVDRSILTETQQDRMEEAIRLLPLQQRKAFIMKYIEGYSAREIAEILQSNENQVNQWCFKARKNLNERLAQTFQRA